MLERLIPFSRPGLFRKPRSWHQNVKPGPPGKEPHGASPVSGGLKEAVEKAQEALLAGQQKEGFWCAELRADTTLESDTIMALFYLDLADPRKVQKLARHILHEQLPDGGWSVFRHGPADLSATVKAYWALKFAGHSPEEPALRKARARIEDLGGIHRVNTYLKFYMALFGLYDWEGVPTIPPEIMLFPNWFYFNLYSLSAWTRAIVVPLTIVWAQRPQMQTPPQARLDELFEDECRFIPLKEVMAPVPFFSWKNFFLWWDVGLKRLEGHGPHFLRTWSLRLAEEWLLEHLEDSDGLGAIFPGILNTLLAMKALGYPATDPRFQRQFEELEALWVDRGDSIEVQPCFSPVWDTAISVVSLAESGLRRDHPALVRSAEWLLECEVRRKGDWTVRDPHQHPGGWAFEFHNEWYPDIDDTAMVLLALRQIQLEEGWSHAREKACLRGLHWLLSMQCRSGGWAAFDRDNTQWIFTKIPFADHNAMIDPPTADITGRVLEILGHIGYDRSYPCVQRAVEFLKREQERDGSWFGRWGVNYLYGTWQVLRGLAAIGEPMDQLHTQKAIRWLKSVQHEDGGWGETCATYENPSQKGRGPSTPSQTAWATMGLLAAGWVRDPAVDRGIAYLLSAQSQDGTWEEEEFTGTGFPGVFYLEYTLYRNYFPLLALGLYQRLMGEPSLAPPAGLRAPSRSGVAPESVPAEEYLIAREN
ncbi:MAG: squalene--hopene cyclase [Elusimicrobia bacterium]|nr:squalene--hopene cyclase [Elusimicrobiota bacterium]